MNILVIGSGGREHAVLRAFAQSPTAPRLFCTSSNAGHRQLAQLIPLDLKNHAEVIQACRDHQIEFVFIGPEDPLVDGLADSLRQAHITVFGPSGQAAQLEGSKIFAKAFMQKAGVPTAKSVVVTSVEATLKSASQFTPPYILKADGLAAGKGVFICADLNELKIAAETLFERKLFGEAGARALLEQNLPGYELSFLVLTNGVDFRALPVAQDHKRLLDHNKGPNTGGMGTVAPVFINSELEQKILKQVVAPSVMELQKQSFLFRGVLFIGLMIVDHNPYVLEYNVRFGDPETQVILPLIQTDVLNLFYRLGRGELLPIQMRKQTACCIVNAAAGYPDRSPQKSSIELPENTGDQYILHAGTVLDAKGQLQSNGGRVLNVIGIAPTMDEAIQKAYALNDQITFPGRQFRTDIGQNEKS